MLFDLLGEELEEVKGQIGNLKATSTIQLTRFISPTDDFSSTVLVKLELEEDI